MDQQSSKQQFVERVKQATNVLVTVSKDPTLDQLSGALGLTLMLNKMGKHATAVVSGDLPSAMQFLEPSKTIDNSVDSLRDFVISLSTEKADKLRYKKEDGVVKIFITPYKTKLSQDDFEFTQGDFNVDVVIALGVSDREHLDEAIRAHGRILHDATVITINNTEPSSLGSIDWTVPEASSLSEMLVSISEAFEGGILDEPMSTAFLTGIVSATDRFRNSKTSPKVMTMAAQLMAAGANQQLVATNLDDAKSNANSSVTRDVPEVDLPPVVEPNFDVEGEEQPPTDINDLLKAAEDSAQQDSASDDDSLEGNEIEAQLAQDDDPSTTEESLQDLQKELESLGDDSLDVAQPDTHEDSQKQEESQVPAMPHETEMPDFDTVDLNTDATSALPLQEEANTPSNSSDFPTAGDIQANLNPGSLPPQAPPANQALNAAPATPSGNQVQTSPIVSDIKPSGSMLNPANQTLGGFDGAGKTIQDMKQQETASRNNAILSRNAPPTLEANMTNDQVQMGQNQAPQISRNQLPAQPLQIDVDDARRAVEEAAMAAEPSIANNPIQALGAQEMPMDPSGPAMAIPPPQPQLPPQPNPLNQGSPAQQPTEQFGLPQQQQAPPPQSSAPTMSPLAPPPPPPGGSAPVIAPKVSPANLGSFAPAGAPQQAPPMPAQPAPAAVQQPTGQMPPLGPPSNQAPQQPPQFGMPPAPDNPAPPPAPIQFDTTPPPGNMPGGRPY